MTQANKGPDEPGFKYESDASASFLVVTSTSGALEYQCAMIGRNEVRGLITPERVVKDGLTCFYYNITSRIPLSVYIKRKKLSKPEFLKLVLDIASAVNDSYGYLLNASNFVLRQDYIYLSPDTLEPYLVYVPSKEGGEDCEALKSLVSELLLQHIQVEGFDSDNIVQRILSAVKSESFNLRGFVRMISELLYGGNSCDGMKSAAYFRTGDRLASCFIGEEATPAGGKAAIVPDKTAVSGGKIAALSSRQSREKAGVKLFTIFAVILQFAMALLIYLCRGVIDKAGANHTANYTAVLLIAAAIDVLVFKKLLTFRTIRPGPQSTGIFKPAAPMPQTAGPVTFGPETQKPVTRMPEIPKPGGKSPEAPEVSRRINKTELLSRHQKGVRVLKSTGKRAGESDIVIDREDIIIGRLEGHVDHVINNNAVGKLHAELISRNGKSYVKDLNSINGTFINDSRIESNKEYELKANDRLQLANSEYIFLLDY